MTGRNNDRGNGVKNIITVLLLVGLLSACSDGSTPTAPVNPEPLTNNAAIEDSVPSATVEQIHASALVLDAHADIEIPGAETRYAGDDGRSQVAPDKMRAGGVDAVVMAIAVGPGGRDEASYTQAQQRAQAEIEAIQSIVADPANNMVLAQSPEQLKQAHRAGQGAYILGFQNARMLANAVEGVDEFYAQGVRVFALTHMGHNNFADSSRPVFVADLGHHEPDAEHGGLSDLGRQAIARVNQLGGIVDVSQLRPHLE